MPSKISDMKAKQNIANIAPDSKSRKFLLLRARMLERNYDQKALADELLRGITYVNVRLNGKEPWPMDEAYAILELLEIPIDQIHRYFPPIPKAKSHKRKKVRMA